MAAGTYTMAVDSQNKTFKIVSSGTFTVEVIAAFQKEFLEKANAIDTSAYTLSNDTRELQTTSPEAGKALGGLMAKMLEFQFKKIVLPKSKNAIAQMQAEKLGRNIPHFDVVEFVDAEKFDDSI